MIAADTAAAASVEATSRLCFNVFKLTASGWSVAIAAECNTNVYVLLLSVAIE